MGNERATEILRRKTKEASYPLGETDQYEDQWKDILNLILKGKICQIPSDFLTRRGTMSRRGLLFKEGAVKQQ